MDDLVKFYNLLTRSERKNMVSLLGMTIVMATFEIIGIASIMPFMAILANPEIINENEYLSMVYGYFEFNNTQNFLYFFGLMVFIATITSLSVGALTSYMQINFALAFESNISRRLLSTYLHQPYVWFLNQNSADLGKSILSEVGVLVGSGLLPLMVFIAQSTIVVAIFILLLLVNPALSIGIIFSLGSLYGLLYIITKDLQERLGESRMIANGKKYIAINEVFGAIKEVKVRGVEDGIFLKHFSKAAQAFARDKAIAQSVAFLPRFLLEAVAFGGILLIILYMMSHGGDLSSILPTITLYAVAGYRLLPSLQKVYSSISQLNFARPSLNLIHDNLFNLEKIKKLKDLKSNFNIKNKIQLNNIYFKYPNSDNYTINNMTIEIEMGSVIGIVGATGCGKSTLIDIIMGLIEPQKGSLLIDNVIITRENQHQWRKQIGYVPQEIYLTDGSILENIAFGVPYNEINSKKVVQAAKIANIHSFISMDLAEGYDTHVGERGVRFSGGQRQRIGIARALYENPKVIVLDEATSALDSFTESHIMDYFNNLGGDTIVIVISHSLSAIKNCNKVFFLKNGSIDSCEDYKKVIKNDDFFQGVK
jgi:ATP-binding cassette, subfamily B, bacterial PglK